MKIVFFDGVCNLCDYFISTLFSLGLPDNLKVASLQGKAAQTHLAEKDRLELSSVLYLRGDKTWRESTAVLYILSDLKWYFIPLRVFLVIPAFLRNPVYRFVAKNRYRWFGKKETCRLPTNEERTYFLD